MIFYLSTAAYLIATVYGQIHPDDPSCYSENDKIAREVCKIPRFFEKSIDDQCTNKYRIRGPRPPVNVQKIEGSCTIECIFVKMGSFTYKNNTLDKEALKRGMAKAIGSDKFFGSITNNSIDFCYEEVRNNTNVWIKPISFNPAKLGCSFVPEAFEECLKENIFMNCPEGNWTSVPDCDELKDKINAGCSFDAIKEHLKTGQSKSV